MRSPRMGLLIVAVCALSVHASSAFAVSGNANPLSSGANGGDATATRVITFAGREWLVKDWGATTFGPGPNYFSDSIRNVWVDQSGRLHLKLTKQNGTWYAAEVIAKESLGHGKYSFTLDSPVDDLDPNVTLGLFTWSDTPDFNNREIDIEFARWGNPLAETNAQWVVQPHYLDNHMWSFRQNDAANSTHTFTWEPTQVAFTTTSGTVPFWSYSGADVPPAGDERVHMNLWLLWGQPPMNGKTQEVIVSDFTFTPMSN
ncbi:MAG TPA: hypothetical protein PLV41_08775 [Miltoncostaeales bacterium]|nr:hypothetical protein [Miltoncostaeales bacterium]